jgi:hypothetical protein
VNEDEGPRPLGCAWAFLMGGLMWVTIFGVAAIVVSRCTG